MHHFRLRQIFYKPYLFFFGIISEMSVKPVCIGSGHPRIEPHGFDAVCGSPFFRCMNQSFADALPLISGADCQPQNICHGFKIQHVIFLDMNEPHCGIICQCNKYGFPFRVKLSDFIRNGSRLTGIAHLLTAYGADCIGIR